MDRNYRRCISCRKTAPKSDFWRVVRVFPTGTVQLDQGMGRSAYLCPNANCLQMAQRKNRLGRSLKASIPEAIYEVLGQRLLASHTDNPPILSVNPHEERAD
jgi:uncharacterized protein